MTIFFQEVIALLPVIVLCMATFLVLLLILIHRNHRITFFITISGISLSFFSLYFVWNNGLQKVTDLMCVDGFSLLCMILVLVSSFSSSIISRMWLSRYCSSSNYDEFYLLLLIFNIGSIIVINSSHVVTLFFGIELMSLPLFGLMSYFNIRVYSLEATIKYVLLSGISTAFLLFGISLVYIETKYLSFFEIYLELLREPALNQSKLLMSGVIMVLFGLGFKLSLVPFHLWTADVYQGVSEISGMYLATISKISIFSVLMRFFLLFPESYNTINYVLVVISCLSILFGNLMAVNQDNMKRIIAYSSIAHMGYLLVGIVASMKESSCLDSRCILSLLTNGVETISLGLINYLLSTLGMFSMLCVLSCYYNKDDNKNEKEKDIGVLTLYRGLFWRDPALSIIFTVIILSLSGMPATLGFISKFYLIALSMKSELLCCTTVIVLGTVIGMLYYLRMIITLYLSPLPRCFKHLDNTSSYKMNCSVISHAMTKYCKNSYFLTSSLLVMLIVSLFLLFSGMYPQFLIYLFFLIQENF